MSRYSRVGKPRPMGGGFELAVWYLMRLSGLALFVLAVAHFLIMHVVFDPDLQTADWIAANRWNSIFWRSFDWLLLMTVLFHSFFGVRTVVADYAKGGARTALMMGLYALAAIIFVIGTIVVMTMPLSGSAG